MARFFDRWSRARLTTLTTGAGLYAVAGVCTVLAATMPAMELVPFSANVAGAALTCFGLSLIACDGLLASFGFLFTAATFGVTLYMLL